VPRLRKIRSPVSVRVVPPSFKRTSSVLGAENLASPIMSSAPLALYLLRCMSMRPLTISRFRFLTAAMSLETGGAFTPNSRAWRNRCATLALQISFLVGRQLVLGMNHRSSAAR
jgi:hypothetical protein